MKIGKKVLLLVICLAVALCSVAGAAGESQDFSSASKEEGYIGIISAMENEIRLLLSQAEIDHTDTIGSVDFHVGKLCGRNVVIAQAGIGKVFAAAGTSTMLSHYPVTSLIFTGIAGGVGDETHVLDIVIADRLVQHDYGTYAQEGFQWNPSIGGEEGYYACDEQLIEAAYRAAKEVVGEDHVFKGLVATGDQFVASESYVKHLQDTFGAIACEMEGASVAAVCGLYDIPCVIIRTMSDKADGNAHESIENMGDLAADQSGRIVIKMLEEMAADELPLAS